MLPTPFSRCAICVRYFTHYTHLCLRHLSHVTLYAYDILLTILTICLRHMSHVTLYEYDALFTILTICLRHLSYVTLYAYDTLLTILTICLRHLSHVSLYAYDTLLTIFTICSRHLSRVTLYAYNALHMIWHLSYVFRYFCTYSYQLFFLIFIYLNQTCTSYIHTFNSFYLKLLLHQAFLHRYWDDNRIWEHSKNVYASVIGGATEPYRIYSVYPDRQAWANTQRAHDLNITSPKRRCNVMTLHRHWGDVIFTSWRCIDVEVTLYLHDVNITSPQRRCNVMTLHRRWGDFIFTTLYLHEVNITSPQRRCNVMTLHRRWGDVIFTSDRTVPYLLCVQA